MVSCRCSACAPTQRDRERDERVEHQIRDGELGDDGHVLVEVGLHRVDRPDRLVADAIEVVEDEHQDQQAEVQPDVPLRLATGGPDVENGRKHEADEVRDLVYRVRLERDREHEPHDHDPAADERLGDR